MSNSYRDKNAHKARNPKKYFGEEDLPILNGEVNWRKVLFQKGLYPTKKRNISWSIHGKRRRGSTRKGNQKVKQMLHQMDRAKLKSNLKKELALI